MNATVYYVLIIGLAIKTCEFFLSLKIKSIAFAKNQ